MSRYRSAFAVGLLLSLAGLATGCFNPFQPLISSQTSHIEPAPSPTGPREVVQLFKWCWENRNISYYHEIFTEDYRFAFSLVDSAGEFYRTTPWTREDEMISAQNLFVGGSASEPPASNITLIFAGDLKATQDFRPGKEEPWHQQIQIPNLTLTVTKTDGSGLQVTGGALFYLVRGDSATIPQELKDKGFGPDVNRWYIERWEDQTTATNSPNAVAPGSWRAGHPGSLAGTGGPAEAARYPFPDRVTWGYVKAYFRNR